MQTIKHTPLGRAACEPLGFRKDGRPIFPIAGGADDDLPPAERTHPQIISRMEEVTAEVERLAAKETMTQADEEYREQLLTEFDTLDQERARLETKAAAARVMSVQSRLGGRQPEGGLRAERGAPDFDRDSILEPDSIEERRFKNPWDLTEVRTFGREPEDLVTEYRARALSAVEKMPQSNDDIRSTATQMIERWDDEDGNLSRLVLAISSPAYVRAWSKLAVNPQRGWSELSQAEALAMRTAQQVQRAMSLTDAAGGFLVPFQLDPTVILTSDGSYNEIRQIARQVIATGDVWNGVSAGAVSWSFDAEAAEVSDDTPTLAGPAITVRTARGFVPISLEARMDAANVAAEVARLLAQGKDDLEAVKFISGAAGSNEPIGIITALTGVTASTVASSATDTFDYDDLYLVQGALPARYRRRASWLAANPFWNLVRAAAPAQSDWNAPSGDRPAEFLGKRAAEAEAMDGTVTATEDNLLAIFGDFENYVIADRIGMTTDFIPHLFGSNRRPTGQSGWFAYYRVGADSVNDGAFRVYNVT